MEQIKEEELRDNLQEKLKNFAISLSDYTHRQISSYNDIADISVHDIGMDSFDVVTIFLEVEEEYKIKLSDDYTYHIGELTPNIFIDYMVKSIISGAFDDPDQLKPDDE